MLYESPETPPYYCKIGITDNPLRRLTQLQAGNPRALRTWTQEQRPNKNFGLLLPSKNHAIALEKEILSYFQECGMRTQQDFDYARGKAPHREWIEGIKPDKAWGVILDMWANYVTRHNLLPILDKITARHAIPTNSTGET